MKRLIIGLFSLVVLLGLGACSNSKKFVGYKKAASEKYTIEQYIEKSLFQHNKYSQVFYASQSLSSDRLTKQDANKNVQRRQKEMQVICTNYGGKIVDTNYNMLEKIKPFGKIEACQVNGKDIYAYTLSPVDTRKKLRSIAFKGESPYQIFWVNDIHVMQLTEKDHREKIKNDKKEKERQLELEKAKVFNDKQKRLKRLKIVCHPYSLGVQVSAGCRVYQVAANGQGKPFNMSQCLREERKKSYDEYGCSELDK